LKQDLTIPVIKIFEVEKDPVAEVEELVVGKEEDHSSFETPQRVQEMDSVEEFNPRKRPLLPALLSSSEDIYGQSSRRRKKKTKKKLEREKKLREASRISFSTDS